jgi:hypothetical protein
MICDIKNWLECYGLSFRSRDKVLTEVDDHAVANKPFLESERKGDTHLFHLSQAQPFCSRTRRAKKMNVPISLSVCLGESISHEGRHFLDRPSIPGNN